MKIGVMFNPGAGGSGRFADLGNVLSRVLSGDQLVTTGFPGEDNYLSKAEVLICPDESDFEKDFNNRLDSLISNDVEMIIGIGGDGYLTHIAGSLHRRNSFVPLMGVAGGTANIGPLIKFDKKNLEMFSHNDFFLETVGCIEVTTGGKFTGFAFCDVIFGDTFLGSMGARTCNFNASVFLENGRKIEKIPGKHIVRENFTLLKNNREENIKTTEVAQIIVSPLYRKEFYRGKAITGLLCLSPNSDYNASVGICDSILVNSNPEVEDSFVIEHLLFRSGDTIRFENLHNDTSVIIDGNVYKIADNSVSLRYIENGVQSVTMNSHCGFPVYID